MLARSWRVATTYLIPERWWSRTWWVVFGGSVLLVMYSLVSTLTVARQMGIGDLTFWDLAQNTLGNFFLVLHGWTNLYLVLAAQLGARYPFDNLILLRVGHRKTWLGSLGIVLIGMTGLYSFLLVLTLAAIAFPWVTFAPHWSNFFPLYFRQFSMMNMEDFLTLPAHLTVFFTWVWLTLGWLFLASLAMGVAWFTGRAALGFLVGWLVNYSVFFVQELPSVWRVWPHRFLYFWHYGSSMVSGRYFFQGVAYWIILLVLLWGFFLMLSKKWEDPWMLSAPRVRFRECCFGVLKVSAWQWNSMFTESKWWGLVALVNGIHGYIIGAQAFLGNGSLNRTAAFLWAYGGPPLGTVDWWPTVIWFFQGITFLFLLSFWLAPTRWNILALLLPRLKRRRRWLAAMWVTLAFASLFYVTWSLLWGGVGLFFAYGKHNGWLSILQISAGQESNLQYMILLVQLWFLLVLSSWVYGLGIMGWILWRASYISGLLAFSFLGVITWLTGVLDPSPVWHMWLPLSQGMLLHHAPWAKAFPTFTVSFSLRYLVVLSLSLMVWMQWQVLKADLMPRSI